MLIFGRGDLRHALSVLLGGWFLIALGLIASGQAMADRKVIYECTDPATGERTLRDFCPPGMESREWTKIYLPGQPELNLEQLVQERPIELYTAQGCESCDLLRGYLRRNQIPYQEKDVTFADPAEASKQKVDEILVRQAELQERSGGLTVPTLFIGGAEDGAEASIIGYNLPRLEDALKQAGYPVGAAADDGGESSDAPEPEEPGPEPEPE